MGAVKQLTYYLSNLVTLSNYCSSQTRWITFMSNTLLMFTDVYYSFLTENMIAQ